MKLRLHNEESDSLHHASYIVLESPKGAAKRYELETVRGEGRERIVALKEVHTREDAEQLRSYKVYLHRDVLPPLAEDEYFLIDLVGAELIFEGNCIGIVDDVRPDPSVDTLIIKGDEGIMQLPLVNHWLELVDTKAKRIVINTLDGLMKE